MQDIPNDQLDPSFTGRYNWQDWCTQHQSAWLKLFMRFFKEAKDPLTIVEVGSFEGRSTTWFAQWLKYNPTSRLYCIDTWEGGEDLLRAKPQINWETVESNFHYNISILPTREQIVVIKGKSEEQLGKLLGSHYRKVDCAYVDGSHTRRDTLVDVSLALSLVRKGGIVIVDDYLNMMGTRDTMLRPKEAVDFIVNTFQREVKFFLTNKKQAVIVRMK